MKDFEDELLDAIMDAIKPAMINREWIRSKIAPVIAKYMPDEDNDIYKRDDIQDN